MKYSPKPEVDEIARIIGRKIIDRNEDLCTELNCLKEIVGDFLTHQFNTVNILGDSSTGINTRDVDTRHNEHINVDTSIEGSPHGKYSDCSVHGIEFVESIKEHLCLNNIHIVADAIRQALEDEKDDLEAEIQVLQSTMDLEAEVQSRGNTPRAPQPPQGPLETASSPKMHPMKARGVDLSTAARYLQVCSSCGEQLPVVGGAFCAPGRVRKNHRMKPHHKEDSPSTPLLCVLCVSGYGHGSSDNSVYGNGADHSLSVDRNMKEHVEDSLESRPVSRTRSRVRNRIESARDERFLLDEDIFLH